MEQTEEILSIVFVASRLCRACTVLDNYAKICDLVEDIKMENL